MSIQYGVALFTFDPEEDTEIRIQEGEKVKIYNEDIGEGWVEGENAAGQRGIFPRNYINITGKEDLDSGSSNNTSPQKSQNQFDAGPRYDDVEDINDDWGSPTTQTEQNLDRMNSYSGSVHSNTGGGQPPAYVPNDNIHKENTSAAGDHNKPSGSSPYSAARPPSSNDSEDTPINTFLSRYMNRFTYFNKSQAEEYILGILTLPAPTLQTGEVTAGNSSNLDVVSYSSEGPIWLPSTNPFDLKIQDYEKAEAKSILSFSHLYFKITTDPLIEQDITTVNRKYEHFVWLHSQLERKYPVCLVPALPLKSQIDEAAMTRQVKLLNIWAKQVSNHPILQQSTLIKHFCILNDSKNFKKSRKKAEQDKHILGATFKYANIADNQDGNCVITTDAKGENELARSKKLHETFTSQLTGIVNSAHQIGEVHARSVSPCIKNLQAACLNLGDVLTEHRNFGTFELGNAFTSTSSILNDINNEVMIRPRAAHQDLMDKFWVHRKKLENWPNLFNINELTLHKMKDADNLRARAKKKPEELQALENVIELTKSRTNRVLTIGGVLGCYKSATIH